jgi:hypothetical protein
MNLSTKRKAASRPAKKRTPQLSAKQLEQLADLIATRIKPVPDVMTIEEAADYLRYSISLLEGWRRDGGGPKFSKPFGARVVGYRKVDLDSWLLSKCRSNSAGAGP